VLILFEVPTVNIFLLSRILTLMTAICAYSC